MQTLQEHHPLQEFAELEEGEIVSGVKRVVFMLDGCVHCEPLSSAWDHLPRYVLASDYDRDTQALRAEIERYIQEGIKIADQRDELRARIAELEGAQLLIGELAATIPVSSILGALETGRAMVDYFKSLHAERDRLHALINNPHTDDWFEGVRLEAAHQVERWGAPHDQGKTAVDWVFLIGHLATKAALAALSGDETKARHHTISTAAVCLNWFRAIAGESSAMRPGIEEPK